MNDTLVKFLIEPNITVLDALKKIDENDKEFLLVVDSEKIFLGILTEEDVRRAIITGYQINDKIENIYNKRCISLKNSGDIISAIELFENNTINFLPITDERGRIETIITKKQLQYLFLQDMHINLDYDFTSLDREIIEYDIFKKPWGFYKTMVFNQYFQLKIISLKPGGSLSLQSHFHREEHWMVVHGTGNVQIGESIIKANCGDSMFIPKECKHRIVNIDRTESLIIIEVQIGDYLGEDDIVRYEDIYGRV